MICFAQKEYKSFAERLIKGTKIETGNFSINRFPNKELYILVNSKVQNIDCLVVGTLAPPDENLISLILLCHSLKKEGAKKIKLILPYIAYTRQDKAKPAESFATALIGDIFKVSGIDEIVTLDVHSPKVSELFPIPLISLSPVQIFVEQIKKSHLQDSTLVAPDKNALARVQEIIKLLNLKDSTAYLDKQRTLNGVKHLAFHGEVKSKAIIIDDMLDTGETLISCSEQLIQAGVKEIVIMVTHGLFTGEKWKKLWELKVRNIYCLDTVLPLQIKDKRVIILSSIPLLKEEIHEKPRT